ncbi:RNA binding protein fox-1 homolog 1-like isoform X2 [Nerophis ophidion]|uniref:RNA binding protein fox-1 homolog 1-like isoform X2 n=1 Tax=Nerophis ophidion TaxID=159077 RepID=UPI002AE08207|nr:RNA binding protein fox-1 homolog 1-like isoform X2 [Nerophis ophidion]
MLSSPAVILQPYGLPVYPQSSTCYPGMVQGGPTQEAGPGGADPALSQVYAPPPSYPVPGQGSATSAGRLPPLEFAPAHPASEYPERPQLRVYQGPQLEGAEPLMSSGTDDAPVTSDLQAPPGGGGEEEEEGEGSAQPKRLHVSNIPFRFRDPDLRQMFGQFGKILDVEIIFNERGSKGFGFVTFESAGEADRAREKLNGTIVEGRKIEVNNATARVVTKKPQTTLVNGDMSASGWKINPVMGAMYAPELYTVASFPYPMAAPALAYRGSALRGRGRAVYNAIRSAAATPAAVPAYPGVVYQDGLYGAELYAGYPAAYRMAQSAASATATYSDGYGRVYAAAADPYHHSVGPTTTYGVGTVASLYRGGYNRFTPY